MADMRELETDESEQRSNPGPSDTYSGLLLSKLALLLYESCYLNNKQNCLSLM